MDPENSDPANATDAADETSDFRSFCRAFVDRKRAEDTARVPIRAATSAHQAAIAGIREIMRQRNLTAMAVSADRTAQVSTSRRVGGAVRADAHVRPAVASLTDVELTAPDPQGVANLIFLKLQEARSTTRERLIFRARRADDEGLQGAESVAAYTNYTGSLRDLQRLRAAKREATQPARRRMDEAAPGVRLFMERQNITSQEVNLTGGAGSPDATEARYFVHTRTSSRKPPLTPVRIRGIIFSALGRVRQRYGPCDDTGTLRDALSREIMAGIDDLPPVVKKTVTMDKAPTRTRAS